MTRIADLSSFNSVREDGLAKLLPPKPRIAVGMGTCGTGNGAEGVFHAFSDEISQRGLGIQLARTGCFGFCAEEPLVNVWIPGKPLVILRKVQPNDTGAILDAVAAGTVPFDLALCRIDEWDHITAHIKYGTGFPEIPLVAGSAVLQGPEEDRTPALRTDQPWRYRRVFRGGWISGAV